MPWHDTAGDAPARPVFRSMLRGFLGACPACGKRGLFRSFLKVNDHCPHCGEALHHHRADDAPAYFVIVIVGHTVVPMALAVEIALSPAYWLHVVMWAPLTIGLSLALLPAVKGTIVGLQWANRMHGFDPASIEHESDPVPLPVPVPRS